MLHHKSGPTLKIFKKLVHNERGQEVDENHITSFFQKVYFMVNGKDAKDA